MEEHEIRTALDRLATLANQVAKAIQETRDCLEKLGAVSGLEWSQDLKTWVSKKKLDQLKKEPR